MLALSAATEQWLWTFAPCRNYWYTRRRITAPAIVPSIQRKARLHYNFENPVISVFSLIHQPCSRRIAVCFSQGAASEQNLGF